jgi:hypothetical protein
VYAASRERVKRSFGAIGVGRFTPSQLEAAGNVRL